MVLNAVISRVRNITQGQRDEMFELHSKYFSNVKSSIFHSDFSEKDWVIVLRDGEGRLAGFSTIQIMDTRVNGRDVGWVYSGDTIVNRECWQSPALAGSFAHFLLRITGERPGIDMNWLLITKGYRTYRFLPVYFNEFYPRFDRETPREVTELLVCVCTTKFGSRFDPQSGVLVNNGVREWLRQDLSLVPTGRMKDPHVSFFHARDPHYDKGDELVCMAPLRKENYRKVFWRVVRGTTVRWDE